jgi:uncharacterized membrane protein
VGLVLLLIGLAIFVATHVFVTRREARAEAIARMGEEPYRLVFSAVSLVALVLIGWGFALYRADDWFPLWAPPVWTRHVTAALMLPAVILIVAAYIPGHIKRAVKHPMLTGVKLWAFAHLLANGDLGSLVLFGSILAWAVYDRISLKSRTDDGGPPIPVGGWRNDLIAVIVGILVYLALGFTFHPLVIGVPAFA